MNKRCLTMLLALIAGTLIFGQKVPVVYGKVPIEDLQMTVYEPDTTAPAVILCDYGSFNASSHTFTRIMRIKILRKEGYHFAEERLLTWAPPVISGCTYNLDGDEIQKTKLQKSSIFTKKISSWTYETSFALPAVKDGSVLDILISYRGFPSTWNFQDIIPVRHSEILIDKSYLSDLTRNYFGYIPLDINEPGRWAANNVPAFKPEPDMDSYGNYITRFEFGLNYYVPTWESINNDLLEDFSFPFTSSPGSICLTSIVEDLKKSGLKGEELIREAFDAVKIIKYNDEERLYISKEGLCARYKMLSGNSADINFTLLQLLNRLDLEAMPVVLSTRDNGKISKYTPSNDRLNYMIVALKTENGYRLLDATEEFMPPDLLPDRCINGDGRLITKNDKDTQWIPITCEEKEKILTTYDLSFNDDLSLTGTITINYIGYAAYDFRKEYAKYNDQEEYARALEKEMPGLIVNDITIENATDLDSAVNVVLDARIEGMALAVDNEIYIKPLLFETMEEHPYKNAVRLYPISYSRKKEKQVCFNLVLKEGMKIDMVPYTGSGKMRNNSVVYSYVAKNDISSVNIVYIINVNSLTISEDKYPEMREIYNRIVKKHLEPVIIKTI